MPLMTNYGQEKLPEWFNKHIAEIAERARQLRAEPFQGYREIRQEAIPNDLITSFALSRTNTGNYIPFLNRAQQMVEGAQQRFIDNPNIYMNPYTDRVVKRISEEGGRTLKEQILPALEAKFLRLGQHGSRTHQKMAERAARDLQQEILARQSHALQTGYHQASQLQGQDQLKALQGAESMATLGGRRQAADIAAAAALAEQGRYQQAHGQFGRDLAYQNYLRNQNMPWENLQREAALVQHSPVPTQSVHLEQTPPAPQLTTLGGLGSLATQLLGAGLMSQRRKAGGHIRRR